MKVWWIAPTLLLAMCLPASASLGGDVSSVQSDQAHMKASRRVTQAAGFAIHEIQSSNGAVVREYVSPAGKVFAVTWQSPGHPDMQQLLGSYFEQFQRATQASGQTRVARRAPVVVQEPGLVVEISGVPRRITGRAYVPQMIPGNVSLKQIQ